MHLEDVSEDLSAILKRILNSVRIRIGFILLKAVSSGRLL
jgi:hypothetical protein